MAEVALIIERPGRLDRERFFKRERMRLIFRYGADSGEVAVKSMPLVSVRARLRYKRYAYAEAVHLLRAAELGLPVPKVLAYGESRRLGLVRWNAVVMEFLPHVPLRERLAVKLSEGEQWALLVRAMNLLRQLYECGCNHVDFGPHCVMLDPAGEGDDRLLDFQFCRFNAEPRAETLAAQAGYFAWSVSTNRGWVDSETMMTRWFDRLLAETGFESQRAFLWPIYDRARVGRASIAQRLAQ